MNDKKLLCHFGTAFVLGLGLWLTPLHALQPEIEPDTIVVSDTLHHDDIKRESTFEGEVVMTRGQLVLHSDRLVLSEDEQGFQFGVATRSEERRVGREGGGRWSVVDERVDG